MAGGAKKGETWWTQSGQEWTLWTGSVMGRMGRMSLMCGRRWQRGKQ